MTIEENRRHYPQSDELTNIEEICLSDNITACPTTNNNNNNTIEETAVVHCQPASQEVVEVDSDVGSSSSSYDDEDENKRKWVAQTSPQTTIENKVTNSERTNITNRHKTVYHAATLVLNKNYYANSLPPTDNLDRIDVVPPTGKIAIVKDPEANVEPKSSDTSSQPLCTEDKDERWCTKKRLITISGAVLAGLAIIGILVYLLIPDSCDVCIISRQEWIAQPPKEKAKPLAVIPAKYIIIIHTRTSNPANCFSKAHCSKSAQNIQSYDMKELNKTDISYNWLVGGDGWVYHCRGWDVEGDHTKNYDNKSIGIGFIGTFNKEEPTKDQIEMGKKLIKKGVEDKHISKNYILVGQKQCLQTSSESPGDKLYEIIKKWDNWSPACF